MFVSPKQASQYYKISKESLRLKTISKEIEFITTSGGHHRYKIIPYDANTVIRKKIIYARVSSSKQKKDLDRQINFIKQKFPDYTVIKDIGSGFNFERKGFISLLEQVMSGNIEKIAIAHNDRLTRIGFEFILFICKNFNTELTVLSDKDDKGPKDEFTNEFISVITHYTSKFYGMRKYDLHSKN
jgi:putative resolvase